MVQFKSKSEVLDPPKLNRGQLIHFDSDVLTSTPNKTRDSSRLIGQNLNVEDLGVKNVVFLDWFETTLIADKLFDNRLTNHPNECFRLNEIDTTLESVELTDNVHLRNLNRSTRNYHSVWELHYMGEHFANVQLRPKQSFLDSASVQMQVLNKQLYIHGWLDTYKSMMMDLCLNHKSLTRADIAIDGEAGDNVERLMQKWEKGRVIGRKGKANVTTTKSSQKEVKKLHIGSMSSDKNGTVYNKSDELKRSEKGYIEEAWKNNRLIQDKPIKRFELRMHSKVTGSYDWERFDDPEYLSSIVRTETKNWLEFYYKGKDKNIHRTYKNKTMDWVDWDSLKGELLEKRQALTSDGSHRAKRVIKDLLYLEYVDNMTIDRNFIGDLLDQYHLHSWIYHSEPKWHNKWNKIKPYRNINSN